MAGARWVMLQLTTCVTSCTLGNNYEAVPSPFFDHRMINGERTLRRICTKFIIYMSTYLRRYIQGFGLEANGVSRPSVNSALKIQYDDFKLLSINRYCSSTMATHQPNYLVVLQISTTTF